MKKVVLKLDVHDDKAKQKAFKTVSTLSGIDSIAMDMKTQQLTVIGTVDPLNVVSKLRKYWPTDIVSVGPAKEPEKKEEEKKEEKKPQPILDPVVAHRAYYYPHMNTYYYVQSMEENPNACVILEVEGESKTQLSLSDWWWN